MRTVLRLTAALLLMGTAAWWVQTGQNPGWTKNQVFVEALDEITGISYQKTEDRFVPGVDLLAGAVVAAAVLAGLSFLGLKRPG